METEAYMKDLEKVNAALDHPGNREWHVEPLRKLVRNFIHKYPGNPHSVGLLVKLDSFKKP